MEPDSMCMETIQLSISDCAFCETGATPWIDNFSVYTALISVYVHDCVCLFRCVQPKWSQVLTLTILAKTEKTQTIQTQFNAILNPVSSKHLKKST